MSVQATRKRLSRRPSGRDSVDVRQRFLKRQRARLADRGLIALWVTVTAVVCWLGVAGFAGLSH